MKQIDLGKSGLVASEISLGCMRMRDLSVGEAVKVLRSATESGINFFDHADIYGAGAAEETFGKAVGELGLKREDLLLQTKCGILRNSAWEPATGFNFSKAHIITALEGSLKRLNTDYVDLLSLHRPDTLMEPEEVAAAFDALHSAGKVRYFGVSNQTPGQMELIQRSTSHKLVANQLQFSLVHTGMVDFGLNANTAKAVERDGGILEYCRLKDVSIQAWSPYIYTPTKSVFIDNPDFAELNAKLAEIAEKYALTKDAIATAWILRHPAKMQVIIGSMNPERITQVAKATNITLTHQEWYDLYLAAGNKLP